MVFVISEALINLRFAQSWEATRDQAVYGFAILEEPDNIVNADSSAFHPWVPAPHVR